MSEKTNCNCCSVNPGDDMCKNIKCKCWYEYHVPNGLFTALNNYISLLKEYVVRDHYIDQCSFTCEMNHVEMKIRMLLKEFEDYINSLGSEFVDLQKTLCQTMQTIQDTLDKVDTALENANTAIEEADAVAQQFDELQLSVEEAIDNLQGDINDIEDRIVDLENRPAVTYALSQSGDTITLTGSDGSTSSVTVQGGAPEATLGSIIDVIGGMD